MSSTSIHIPRRNEYLPYYGRYVSLVPKGPIVKTLEKQIRGTVKLLRGISERKSKHRYASDKWTIKQVVGHMIDAERVFSYRALVFARNDSAELPSMEQDPYVEFGNFDKCKFRELVAEFECVRRATCYLFRHLADDAWTRRGIASGAEVSVRALAHIIAGHELHHVNVLKTKYL